ncbi:hypothetical protein BH11PAT2_BH11PAT2_09490 [soil metagenome]
MKKVTTPATRTGSFTVGRSAFAKISALEGVRLTPEMARDFKSFDAKNLSAAERRTVIIQKYGKARS